MMTDQWSLVSKGIVEVRAKHFQFGVKRWRAFNASLVIFRHRMEEMAESGDSA